MERRVAVAMSVAAAGLLAGCGGTASPSTHVLGLEVSRTLGCTGWFEMTGHTLSTHLRLDGAVRSLAVTATLDDGRTVPVGRPVAVPAGRTSGTFDFPGLAGTAVGVSVHVTAGDMTADCTLAQPH